MEFDDYGYLPFADGLHELTDAVRFSQGLVINGPAGQLFDSVEETRFLIEPSVELPEGMYWFNSGSVSIVVLVHESDAQRSGAITASADDVTRDANHPLGLALGWGRHYWGTAREVPSPRFEVGEQVQHVSRGIDTVIRSREFSGGSWQYKVILDGKQINVLEVAIDSFSDVGDPTDWIHGDTSHADHFGSTLSRAKLEGRFSNTIYSFRATRTIFRAYQFKPILKMLQTGKSRILIADEVGLGKTIEAGLVWTELEARKEADRVFIVCPASLVSKWKREMEERFGFEVKEFDKPMMGEFIEKHQKDKLPNRFAYITSIERLRTWKELEFLAEFPFQLDLLIMDEAHAMRNTSTKNYVAGAVMAQLASAAIFLTATPINLRKDDVLSLTGLLAPEDELDAETAEAQLEPNKYLNQIATVLGRPSPNRILIEEIIGELVATEYGALTAERLEFIELKQILTQTVLSASDIVTARRLIADLNALATVITRTRKAEVDDRKTVREAKKVEVQWTEEENDFYREFLKWCQAKAKKSGSHLMFSMQMPLRLASASLQVARHFVLDGASRAESLIDSDEPTLEKPQTYDDVTPELVAAANALPVEVDTKFDHLSKILLDLHRDGRRALLFTFSKPTLRYLKDRLGDRYRVAILDGTVSHEKRNEIMRSFRAGLLDFVFANRVASEGLDFEFCSAVINYDLPWNPMEVEQRIGRIDRIGQPEAKILIINFYNEAAVDERIMLRLLERIKIFEETIGELEPIVHEHMGIIREQLEFDLDSEQLEQKLVQMELALENQKSLLNDVNKSASELFVSNDVDIDGLEEELLKSGRYVGQAELANLITDWAQLDGGKADFFNSSVTVQGNSRMAERISKLSESGFRTRSETERLASRLREELPISLTLDPEKARANGGELLNSNHPLVMAAVSIPAHRQARFAKLEIKTGNRNIPEGTYGVIVSVAKNASRAGDELWGDACNLSDLSASPDVYDLLLSALANGHLVNGDYEFDREQAHRGISRMMNRMNERHAREQTKRAEESDLFLRSRRLALTNQYKKKLNALDFRIDALRGRGVDASVIRMFEGQKKAADRNHNFNLEKLEQNYEPSIEIEHLAVCIMGVKHENEVA